MLDKRYSIWLIGAGVLFFHGILFFLLTRQNARPISSAEENPVLVTLVLPPPPKKVVEPEPETSKKPIIAEEKEPPAILQQKAVPVKQAPSAPVTVKKKNDQEPQKRKPGGAVMLFAPPGENRQTGALGSVLQGLGCASLDTLKETEDCAKDSADLMQGYGDEIKRIAQQADKMLFIVAGSPPVNRPADVSLMNRDPMATISTTGAPGILMERSKELENLHEYKDPVFGD